MLHVTIYHSEGEWHWQIAAIPHSDFKHAIAKSPRGYSNRLIALGEAKAATDSLENEEFMIPGCDLERAVASAEVSYCRERLHAAEARLKRLDEEGEQS